MARLAGVSQAAVSRAFTPGASISQEMRKKVLAAANELGYRPNLIARSLKEGRSGLVGIVLGNPQNPFYIAALEALSNRLAAADKQILVFTTEGNAAGDVHVQVLLKYRVEGLVLMSASLSSNLAEECKSGGIPVVFLNRHAQSVQSVGSVLGANYRGAQRIAEHLLESGYRRLAFMAGFTDSSTSHEREKGFRDYLNIKGVPSPSRAVGHYQRAGAILAARELLSATERPDAIFCANDFMALATIEVAQSEFGLQVGRDLGVVGFDDIDLASWPSFQLTTYAQPVNMMTDAVVDMLLAGDRDRSTSKVVVDGGLVKRKSTQRS